MVGISNCFAITGTAGAGKTTAILATIEAALETRDEEEIYLVGLTHATKNAALARGIELPEGNITTMDSLCFRLYKEWKGVYPALFHPYTGQGISRFKYTKESRDRITSFNEETEWELFHDGASAQEVRDNAETQYWMAYSLLRQKRIPKDEWENEHYFKYLSWEQFSKFVSDYEEWSKYREVLDFTGVKEAVLANEVMLPKLASIVFLDEAQDNNALELSLLHMWGKELYEYWLAGDPNQAIYESMRGAVGPDFLYGVPAENEWKLPKSNRCASNILAYGFELTRRATAYHDYGEVEPRESGGTISVIDLTLDGPKEIAEWLAQETEKGDKVVGVLASYDGSRRNLEAITEELDNLGVMYHNPYSEDWKWRQFDTRTLRRIKAFLKRPWSIENVLDWAELVGTSLVFNHGVLGKLEAKYKLRAVVTEEIAAYAFKEGVAVLSADLEWLHGKQGKSSSGIKSIGAARNIIKRYGGMVEALDAEPCIIVGTVHSVKGGEMDSVLVFPDISYARIAEGGLVSDDEVHRLMYVAVTRARKDVYLAKPMGRSLRDRLYYDWKIYEYAASTR